MNEKQYTTQYKDLSKMKFVIKLEKELNYLLDIINKNKE